MTSLKEFLTDELIRAQRRYETIKNKSDNYSTGYIKGVINTIEDILKNEKFDNALNTTINTEQMMKYDLNGFGYIVITIDNSKVSNIDFVAKNENPIKRDKFIKELFTLMNNMAYEKWDVYDTAAARIMIKDQLEKWIIEIASTNDPNKRSLKVNLI
nr:MAG TPA: hypothetical protein [Caudoviricetes sp.]